MKGNRPRRRLLAALAFLLPNLAGFCAFTLVPLGISVAMAFSDWDFLRRNLFRRDPLHWVGTANFSRLLADPLFWRDLGNTGFLMLGLPFAIAGSLAAALLIDRAGRRRAAVRPAIAAATLIFVASAAVLLAGGMAGPGVLALFGLLAAGVLLAGVFTRGSAYCTLFYLPHFTAGVATYVLWQKLYDPTQGPINAALQPVLDGLARLAHAHAAIQAPDWLGSYGWAKPSLMIMALWAAIGSNNMILYLAGLTAIPPELYEAADLDGASPAQRFWNVTWPQLGPVTVFIAIMGIIEVLQGGFEMARTMTAGGPAGSTTTLSYQIYIEGFTLGRLGYASAVAWVMFLLVFVLSVLNFRHGNPGADE